ncbi:hypothetical protein ACQP0U_15980 [Micromonospora sp. CA-269861]|uniref:hypothetical protein n=1 Tax=Micromonospora sp. CA-269861 TaxID=3239968 RepID=UPI003D8F6DAF
MARQRTYVSELARQMQMNRPLLYMHMQKLEGPDAARAAESGLVRRSELRDVGGVDGHPVRM